MSEFRLRSGVFLPPFHSNEENPALALRRDLKLMQWLDELGFDEAWIGEHHSGGFELISSPELFIAAAAELTTRIRFGTGVVSLSYHHPFNVANRIVQLDNMTMGRVMFGAGPGLLYLDAKMMGIDVENTRGRLVESLDVIMALFRGETVTKKTEWFELDEAVLHVRPYQQPYPEVVVVSSKTPSGGRLAGKYGIGMICVAASQTEGFNALAENWALANEVAGENGHTMDRSKLRLVAPIHLAETRDQAYENVKFGLENWLDYSFTTNPGKRDRAKGMSPIEVVSKTRGGIIGTPDDAIALIDRLREQQGDFGCFLQLAHNWADWEATKKSYELYARYVVPHINKINQSRVTSLDRYRNMGREITTAQNSATMNMFRKHNAERETAGKSTIKVVGLE